MTIIDMRNPLDGLSANQIILLFERGSGQSLKDNLREIAIDVINRHQLAVINPTLKSTMNSMFEHSELREFANCTSQRFLGGLAG